jgi:hypothetical protein
MGEGEIPQYDLYKALEVDPEASTETIEAAHRSLIRRFHPDRAQDRDNALEHTKRLNVARDWLTDPARRASYDRARLRLEMPSAQARPPRPAASAARPASPRPEPSASRTDPEPAPTTRPRSNTTASSLRSSDRLKRWKGTLLGLGGVGVALLVITYLGGSPGRPTTPVAAATATISPSASATPRPIPSASPTRRPPPTATPTATPSLVPTAASVAKLTFTGYYSAKATLPVTEDGCLWVTGLGEPEILTVRLSGGERPRWDLWINNPGADFGSAQLDLSGENLPWSGSNISSPGSISVQDRSVELDVRLDGDPPVEPIRVRGTITCLPSPTP